MTLRPLNYGNYGIFLIMGNAGFCPSAVCLMFGFRVQGQGFGTSRGLGLRVQGFADSEFRGLGLLWGSRILMT